VARQEHDKENYVSLVTRYYPLEAQRTKDKPQQATCNLQQATGDPQRTTDSGQQTTCDKQPATSDIR
jgi:hypothetical protein